MEQLTGPELAGIRRKAARTILAVGEDRETLNRLAQRLGNLGHLVVLSDSGSQALELIAARGFDLVLLDTGDASGAMHLLAEVRGARDTCDLPVVLVAADTDMLIAALVAGADDGLVRPCEFGLLAARIERTLARATRVDELKRATLALDARIAARAMELGELRVELEAARADRTTLIGSIRTLHDDLDRLQGAA
jgi:DNA-binding response OmpR family regulator